MDYYGLFPKFKFNRPLNEQERQYQLKQHEQIDLKNQSLAPEVSVINLNSNYMELVDKYYSPKGIGSLVSFVGFSMFSIFLISVIFIFLNRNFNLTAFFTIIFFTVVSVPAIYWMLKLLKTEWFAWTHYPIRFDRKNRMVHAHRIDGSSYSVPWGKVFFTLGLSHGKGASKDYYISGHVLAEDNITVVDTFCLPATHGDREPLKHHWEFVRRYMEEGPQAVISVVDFCLPIEHKRESYNFGLLYLISQYDGIPLFLLPILFPFIFLLSFIFSIPRYIAIITSKRPIWSAEIEALCPVAADDPYRVTAENNHKTPWRDIFKDKRKDKK
ncbi:DUF6708 domain-containing protein [Serratia sp. DD3]|uniref:DUF6708 domain-containing protein n=1 Tax=Serratia sp. DD3 TaxID=1410619 RepID=UPI0004D489C3|nr:DUF6708 domain-containing protein [Serratia sp. DD3]KEY57162.1 hypothetical protein SRDD_39310 [Serratia sp. DD3]KEY58771.1 hypothetical protein SRDD_22990 [Serratia sp. DD3]